MRRIPTYRDVICVVCGRLIPGYNRTNNRQITCKGACQKQYHAALNRKSSRDQYERDVKSEPHERKSARFCRGIRKDGIHVPEGTVLLDMKWARFIRAGYKKEKRQARSILIQYQVFWEMYVSSIGARPCVGTEPGSPLLNFHEYTASNGKRGMRWYHTGQSAYCIGHYPNGNVAFRYDKDADIMTFWPDGKEMFIRNRGTPVTTFGNFDITSFRKYLEDITPWVLEGLHEAWCKENVEKHAPPPWITIMLRTRKTPRITEGCDCPGRYDNHCDRNGKNVFCHPVMDEHFPRAGPEGDTGPYQLRYYVPPRWSESSYFHNIRRPKPLPADVTDEEKDAARKTVNAKIKRESRILRDKPRGLFEDADIPFA